MAFIVGVKAMSLLETVMIASGSVIIRVGAASGVKRRPVGQRSFDQDVVKRTGLHDEEQAIAVGQAVRDMGFFAALKPV